MNTEKHNNTLIKGAVQTVRDSEISVDEFANKCGYERSHMYYLLRTVEQGGDIPHRAKQIIIWRAMDLL
jgi:hypothetical protein